jgi:hypothetical protein
VRNRRCALFCLFEALKEQVLDEALNKHVLETIRRQAPINQVTFQLRNLSLQATRTALAYFCS